MNILYLLDYLYTVQRNFDCKTYTVVRFDFNLVNTSKEHRVVQTVLWDNML